MILINYRYLIMTIYKKPPALRQQGQAKKKKIKHINDSMK